MAEDSTEANLKQLLRRQRRLSESVRREIESRYEEYSRLIQKMAHKYVRPRVEYDDLVQEALLGFALACRDFNPERSNDFHTYAIYRMKGKMYEYCIGNENPIYVPTHIAKAASYVKQMQRLLDKEPLISDNPELIQAVIAEKEHEQESELNEFVHAGLRELKRKLGNIAANSKVTYENLAGMAMESLSMIVSDDMLSKFPKENDLVEELVSNRELRQQLQESLGEKRFTVLKMRAEGWGMREIAEKLAEMGHTNRQGRCITRQAVKAILEETLRAVKRMRVIKNLLDSKELDLERG